MDLRCDVCGAPYKGQISRWTKFVKCEYCGATISVPQDAFSKVPEVVIKFEEGKEVYVSRSRIKEFTLSGFGDFIRKKGVKTYDPISGVMLIGSQEISISEDGVVSGPKNLRKIVEKWINEYMSQ